MSSVAAARSVDRLHVELWADEGGCATVLALLKYDPELPFVLAEAAQTIRAAYAKGYVLALMEACPLTVEEAEARAELLRWELP